MDVDDDVRTTGRRVRQIREQRGKSLKVVAELVGSIAGHLSQLERGERGHRRRSPRPSPAASPAKAAAI